MRLFWPEIRQPQICENESFKKKKVTKDLKIRNKKKFNLYKFLNFAE